MSYLTPVNQLDQYRAKCIQLLKQGGLSDADLDMGIKLGIIPFPITPRLAEQIMRFTTERKQAKSLENDFQYLYKRKDPEFFTFKGMKAFQEIEFKKKNKLWPYGNAKIPGMIS